MSIYILEDYVSSCRKNGLKATVEGLKQYRKMYWR